MDLTPSSFLYEQQRTEPPADCSAPSKATFWKETPGKVLLSVILLQLWLSGDATDSITGPKIWIPELGIFFLESRPCYGTVRINAGKQTPRYQQLHVAKAVEPLSPGNPAQQKLHRCDKETCSKESETFPDPGAQWTVDVCAFEARRVCWAVQQTYSKSILNFFLLFASSFPFLAKLA